jgi:hypothetical protein
MNLLRKTGYWLSALSASIALAGCHTQPSYPLAKQFVTNDRRVTEPVTGGKDVQPAGYRLPSAGAAPAPQMPR